MNKKNVNPFKKKIIGVSQTYNIFFLKANVTKLITRESNFLYVY